MIRGRFRRWLFVVVCLTIGLAASWTLPGAVGRGVAQLMGQTPTQAPATVAATPPAVVQFNDTPTGNTPLSTRLTGLLGIVVILGIGYAFSSNRRAIRWRIIGYALALQVGFAIFVLRVPLGQDLFRRLGAFVTTVLH